LTYRADLLTELIPGVDPLADQLDPGLPRIRWWQIGQTLRRFHDAGFFHADLNARNILLDPEGGVYVIDWDRGRVRPPGRWARANLARLRRSLVKLSAGPSAVRLAEGGKALETGYATPRNAPLR